MALARLSAGTIHGIDLTPLDAMRWAPYPMPMAAEREEGGTLLTRFVAAFCFDLHGAAHGKTAGAAATAATAPTRECEVVFDLTAGALAGPSATGAATVRCNGLVLDVEPTFFGADDAAPTFGAEGGDGTGGAGGASSSIAAPQKRAVIFFPPTELEVGKRHRVRIRHDGTRFCVVEGPQAAPPSALWGRGLLQHWHFAMLADAPRNDAYAAAIERAVARLHRQTPSSSAAAAPQKVRRERKGTTAGAAATGAAAPTLRGVDLGSGSGLLSLMLARALVAAEGRPPDSAVLGVESVPGVAQLSEVCIAHNGCARLVSIAEAEGHALCERVAALPAAERPAAPLLIAELMDSGGLGEGLLPLAHHAVASGLVSRDAQLIPCRLRVWAMVVELHACGTALDAAELVPSACHGVDLGPWLAFHTMPSYASIDLASADFTPLTPRRRSSSTRRSARRRRPTRRCCCAPSRAAARTRSCGIGRSTSTRLPPSRMRRVRLGRTGGRPRRCCRTARAAVMAAVTAARVAAVPAMSPRGSRSTSPSAPYGMGASSNSRWTTVGRRPRRRFVGRSARGRMRGGRWAPHERNRTATCHRPSAQPPPRREAFRQRAEAPARRRRWRRRRRRRRSARGGESGMACGDGGGVGGCCARATAADRCVLVNSLL